MRPFYSKIVKQEPVSQKGKGTPLEGRQQKLGRLQEETVVLALTVNPLTEWPTPGEVEPRKKKTRRKGRKRKQGWTTEGSTTSFPFGLDFIVNKNPSSTLLEQEGW